MILDTVSGETIVENNVDTKSIFILQLQNYDMMHVPYSWYDAKNNGYNLFLAGDNVQTTINLPFVFPFYDELFNTIIIYSNGILSFDQFDSGTYYNLPLPSIYYNYMIAIFWNDLWAKNNTYIWETSDFFVIEFNNYGDYFDTWGTFEVILFSNGDILFQYENINIDPISANTGTSSVVGLNYGIDTSYYSDNTIGYAGKNEYAFLFSVNLPEHELANIPEEINPISDEVGLPIKTSWMIYNLGKNSEDNVITRVLIDDAVVSTITSTHSQGSIGSLMSYEWIPAESNVYKITVSTEPVNGEVNLENNEFTIYINVIGGPEEGDVNFDGIVDIVDALLIAQHYVGFDLPVFYSSVADVNADGFIDIVDALLVAQYYVGIIPEL